MKRIRHLGDSGFPVRLRRANFPSPHRLAALANDGVRHLCLLAKVENPGGTTGMPKTVMPQWGCFASFQNAENHTFAIGGTNRKSKIIVLTTQACSS